MTDDGSGPGVACLAPASSIGDPSHGRLRILAAAVLRGYRAPRGAKSWKPLSDSQRRLGRKAPLTDGFGVQVPSFAGGSDPHATGRPTDSRPQPIQQKPEPCQDDSIGALTPCVRRTRSEAQSSATAVPRHWNRVVGGSKSSGRQQQRDPHVPVTWRRSATSD